MKNPWSIVKGVPQPPLFHLAAAAVTLQLLIDRDEGSVVFSVQTVDPINDNLVGLWVSPVFTEERYLSGLHEAHREFLQQAWDATGPFA